MRGRLGYNVSEKSVLCGVSSIYKEEEGEANDDSSANNIMHLQKQYN